MLRLTFDRRRNLVEDNLEFSAGGAVQVSSMAVAYVRCQTLKSLLLVFPSGPAHWGLFRLKFELYKYGLYCYSV